MASTPVKFLGIADSDGSDITGVGIKKAKYQELTTTEENYLAYQAGLRLAADSDIAGLTLTSSGNATVGSYQNTEFDAGVGTHGVTLTTTTTTTPVYQKEGTAAESGANFRKPIHYQKSGSQTQFHEMTSSEIDTLTDRLVSRIFTSDYPGSFKLGTSAPSGYTTYLHNVFEDTRTDGHSQNYSIYRRTSMSAPTAVKPLAIKRSLGGSGTYQGLQQMSTAQMQYTFGQRAKNRIMNGSNGVGTYLLLSSTSGTPTANGYSGTWHSKGVAVDTKQATVSTQYTRNFSRSRVSTYAREYVGDYLGEYTRLSTRTRTSNYVGEYTRTRTSNYTRIRIVNRIQNRSSTYQRIRSSNYSRTFEGNYTGPRASNYSRIFTGNYSRDFIGNYARTSVGNFIRTFTDSFTGDFSRDFIGNYTRISTGNFSRSYSRDFVGNYQRTYARTFVGDYTGDYTRIFTGDYTGTSNFSRTFVGNRSSNYSRNRSSNYARSFTRDSQVGYARNFEGPTITSTYQRLFTGNYVGTGANSPWQGPTGSGVVPGFNFGLYNSTNVTIDARYDHGDGNGIVLVRPSLSTGMTFTNARAAYSSITGTGTYAGNVYHNEYHYNPSAVQHSATYVAGYRIRLAGTSTAYTRTRMSTYSRDTLGYTGNFEGNYTGAGTYSPYTYSATNPQTMWIYQTDFVTPYNTIKWSGTNVGGLSNPSPSGPASSVTQYDSTDGYTYQRGDLQSTYSGKYHSEYYYSVRRALSTASYTGTSTRQSFRNFSRNYFRTFTGDYSRNYTRIIADQYARIIIENRSSNYSREFTANINRESNYTRNSILNRSSSYARTFTRERTSTYSRSFARDFTGNYTRTRTSTYQTTRVSNYSRNFSRDFEGNYARSRGSTYTRDRASNYARNFETEFVGNRTSNYTRDFEGNYARIFTGNYTGNYTGDYTRDFEGNYSRTSVGGNFAGNYLGDYTRTSLGNYSRNFNRTFVGNYQGNFTSDEIGSGTETIETYTLYVRTA